ncbi:AAA family ATPase [Rhizobacter sp. P5_C2]
MKLLKLEIDGLYGTLNKHVSFKDEINLLVGINGSGKTSVLNVIDWLLSLSFENLVIAQYKRLALTVLHHQEEFTIEALKSEGNLNLYAIGLSPAADPINVRLHHIDGMMEGDYLERARERYRHLTPDPNEKRTWTFVRQLPRPVVISLDRTLRIESDDDEYVEISRSRRTGRSALDKVMELVVQSHFVYRAKAKEHDEELKAKIVMAALVNPWSHEARASAKHTRRMNAAEVSQLERKVINYLSSAIKNENVTPQVHRFFRGTKDLVELASQRNNESEYLFDVAFTQYTQIDKLAKAFNEYELKIAESYNALKEFLSVVNGFLVDSGKEILIEPGNGKLMFRFIGGPSEVVPSGNRDLSYLSSGEKQILILFALLAFGVRKDSVFIVDEPELSLHPKWQYEFMDAFVRLRPNDTQLLLATHSPEIVGKHKGATISLTSGGSVR